MSSDEVYAAAALKAFLNQSVDPDQISITVGNNQIVGWQSVVITRSVEQFPNSFVLVAADQFPYDAARATVFPTGPGEKCVVKIGSDVVVTGYVDQYGIQVSPESHEVLISGRGLCEDLSDCSADLTSTAGVNGATLTAANTLDLAQKLCAPFSLTARLGASGLDPGKSLPPLTVALGETPYEIIERVARYTGYLVYEDENGVLVLDRVGTQKMASPGFGMPGNIESASSTLSIDQRFTEYTVVWNTVNQYSDVSPIGNNRATVYDKTMPKGRFRPRIIVSEQYDPSIDLGSARANWELARRIGRSQAINLTCDSWRDSAGKLWQPNYLATINAPALKLINVQWIIGTVVFRKDASGTHADLVLMPPAAFTPEPAPLYLWDREIMHATQSSQSPAPPNTTSPPPKELPNGV